jgi:hypothetical protein
LPHPKPVLVAFSLERGLIRTNKKRDKDGLFDLLIRRFCFLCGTANDIFKGAFSYGQMANFFKKILQTCEGQKLKITLVNDQTL